MIAFSFLFFTVLSFGGLMTVYIRWTGMSDHFIGMARGFSSLTGLLGSKIFPVCRDRFKIYNTAYVSILYQFILVSIAASSFYWATPNVTVLLVIFAVLFSRTGLWCFDLSVRQIAQETIPEHSRGIVNGQWRSMIAMFDMSSYLLVCTKCIYSF